jgi:hypothetical protein
MKDETYAFISDVKQKKVTARSARHTRTHCGKGGRVRLPSDNLSKKELMKMNGECKSYRLNEPMTKEELLAMPDDLKIAYIKAIRNKYGIPDSHLGKAMGFAQQSFAKLVSRLGLCQGKAMGGNRKWDKEGFYAWWNGVDQLPTPVVEEPTEADAIEEEPVSTSEEPEVYVEDDLPVEEPDSNVGALPIQFDDYLKVVEELKAVHEKDKAENEWLRNECDNLRIHARILEAQMEVVRLIFGGKNNG